MAFYGRLSHSEEETKALDEHRSGSSTQGDPKARKCTGVGYLASYKQKREGSSGSWAPRGGLGMGAPHQAQGLELEAEPTSTGEL